MSISDGMPWLLNVSQIISRNAPMATANSSVLSELSAQLPVLSCRSILRNAYRSWYFKRRIQEIEGIGIERDLAGLPVIYGPEDVDLWDENIPQNKDIVAGLERMVKNIRRDEMEGVVLPGGYKLELLSSGGTRQFDTNAIINRYDTRIAMTVLADFIFLGHDKTGSWALSSDKTELFAVPCAAYTQSRENSIHK